jgi:glycerol uptake operon antiterminator
MNNGAAFNEALSRSPIVPAVKHPEDLGEVLKIPWVSVIILLGGDINSLEDKLKVRRQYPEKCLLAHIDLISGIGKDESGIRYLKRLGFEGIVSVKRQLLGYAKEHSLVTVHRLFLVDSESIRTGLKVIRQMSPDAIEIMPATIPKFAIDALHEATALSILGGGLLRTEEDVHKALANGLTAVTSSRRDLWNLRLT